MAKHPAILVDDPVVNGHFDLRRTLRGWRAGLAAVITPLADTEDAQPATSATPYAGKNDSESTLTLKHRVVRYRVEGKQTGEREFSAAECAAVLQPLASEAPILVSFVSYATAPLIVALAHTEAFATILRVGVSGVRLDTQYNLARKLIVDGLIHYHEHTLVLEKVLCHRLRLMLEAHEERRRAGSA